MNRSYSELKRLHTFEERFEYLSLQGRVGNATFGHERYLNQRFYTSTEWKQIRDFVIVRDNGCDLGVFEHEIYDQVIIHHLNPMTPEDLKRNESNILDPEYLVMTCLRTHNAIHYGDARLLPQPFKPREMFDTLLWHKERRH